MITSGLARGSWATVTEAVSACLPTPARNGVRLSSSVRVWPELGVVTPATGAHSVRPPWPSGVSQGGATVAGSTVAASPLRPDDRQGELPAASVTGPLGTAGVAVGSDAACP